MCDDDKVDSLNIRDSSAEDLATIERLYPEAFPDEDLLPLVRQLLQPSYGVLSLVGTADGTLVGHVIFTRCRISDRPDKAALLAPLAVAVAHHGQGIGSAIVRAGLHQLEEEGVSQVFVLGDPAYYSRFGFQPRAGVTPPCPIPDEWQEAWQSLGLGGAPPSAAGKLLLPEPWQDPALWAE